MTAQPAVTRALGVIGHVDHGKTALVRALTGIETDRLAEERERGLSIVLGFAHLELTDAVVDLIDVPGHEAFIRAMVAGATGLDGVLLVVAANEGVQPQTREHFAIACLLELECGVVVLTKADLVDGARLEIVRREIAALTRGTFLESAEVVAVSVTSGQGMVELIGAIDRVPGRDREADAVRPFCLPLDRVFSKHGFGVVGTGTVRSGRVSTSDAVDVLPQGLRATVRGLQRHGVAVDTAKAGERVAVNLRGINRDQLARGDVIATADAFIPTARVDAVLELLPDASSAVRNGMSVRLFVGTTDVIASVRLLDRRELERGESGLAQLRCERPVVVQRGERYIVRSDSPSRTLGGGHVIEPHASRHRRFDADAIEALQLADSTSPRVRAEQALAAAGCPGISVAALAERAGLPVRDVPAIAEQIGGVWIDQEHVIAQAAADEALECVRERLRRYHAEHPMRRGMSASELAAQTDAMIGERTLRWALATLRDAREVDGSASRIHLSSFDPFARLSDAERRAVEGLAAHFLRGGIEPPELSEIIARGKPLSAIAGLLLESGELVKLQSSDRKARALHAETLQDVQNKLATRYPYPAEFAVKDARDLLGSTRKYVLPILEHLDATGFTLRRGDLRQLRNVTGGE